MLALAELNVLGRTLSCFVRTEYQGIPALVSNNCVCSSDSAKAEALREQYNSVFLEEDLRNLPQMPPLTLRMYA